MITDRTKQDVARWKELHDKGWLAMTDAERKEWSGEMKGRYAATDMNRVENAVGVLSAQMVELGYLDAPLTVRTNWNMWSVPTRQDMVRYLENVATLRGLMPLYADTPEAPTINQKFNYERANDLEQILLDVDRMITSIPQSWFYAGEIMSGEV